MTDPLYRSNVEIGADLKPLKEGISDAKREVESLGDAGEDAGKKASGGFKEMFGSMTRIVSIAGSVAAAISSIASAVKALNEYFRDGKELANDFLSGIGRDNNPEAALEAVQKRLIEVNAELERLNANPSTIFGRNRDQIEEELEQLLRANASIGARIRAQRLQQGREEVEGLKSAIRDLNAEAQVNLLPEDDQIIARANLQIRSIRELLGDALGRDSELDALFKAYVEFIQKKKNVDLEELREREKREAEANARVAKKYGDDLKKAFDDAAASLRTITGSGLGDFTSMVNALNNVERAVREAGNNRGRF
jgi:hypothetical protein